MELENIVANTVYIKVREGRGRSKKWKDLLKLPPIGSSLHLRDKIEHSFEYLVEKQPVGHKLFLMFCEKDLQLSRCMQFLHAADETKLIVEGKRLAHVQPVFDDFISTESMGRLAFISEAVVASVRDRMVNPIPINFFDECRQKVREFLSGQPLIDFIDSPYYWRYLQWKSLEKMLITKDHFREYRVLGKGGFGLVYACQSKFSGKLYALKKLDKKRVKKRRGEKLALNEKEILEKIDSRFVVNLVYAYQSKDSLCMVLTLMNSGDLRFHIYNIGTPGLTMERVVFYAAEIACGLHHLHTTRIAYRDMKPDNILLDEDGHIRISDLGLAVYIPEGQSVRGKVGTPGYMAPEVIDGHRYTFSPDWWGLGCLIYEMIAGRTPFRRHKEKISREEIEKKIREDNVVMDDKFSDEAKQICTQLLDKVHATRLGCCAGRFDDIKAHPFFHTVDFAQLEAGILQPPFKPNPKAVYAKDVLDIDQFSSVRGVEIERGDVDFADKFATGAVSKAWQEEMIEIVSNESTTSVFDDINELSPMEAQRSMSLDMVLKVEEQEALRQKEASNSFFGKFFRPKRQASIPHL